MTHACCANCRIRFTPTSAAHLAACPACGEPLQPLGALAGAVGYRLFRLEDVPIAPSDAVDVSMPVAGEVSMPIPGPRPG